MPPACDRPPERASHWFGRRPAELLLLIVLLSGCAAAISKSTDDLSTTTHVKIELLNDRDVGPLRLDVRTAHGVVTLSGTVKTQAQADRAVAVAKTIHGVRAVT